MSMSGEEQDEGGRTAFCPVISRAAFASDKRVRLEQRTSRTGTYLNGSNKQNNGRMLKHRAAHVLGRKHPLRGRFGRYAGHTLKPIPH